MHCAFQHVCLQHGHVPFLPAHYVLDSGQRESSLSITFTFYAFVQIYRNIDSFEVPQAEELNRRRLAPWTAAHWLGMDVHDCGDIKMDALELQPGVALTVEPGLYIPDEVPPPP